MQDFDLLKEAVVSGNRECAMAITKSNPVALAEFLEKWPGLAEKWRELVSVSEEE